jgi:ABC-type transporter Mla subunit MlaD
MEHEQIGTALKRIADATGRLDAAAARLRDQFASVDSPAHAALPSRDAVTAALAELDALLEQLQR